MSPGEWYVAAPPAELVLITDQDMRIIGCKVLHLINQISVEVTLPDHQSPEQQPPKFDEGLSFSLGGLRQLPVYGVVVRAWG